jgi:hypothetical protein
MTVAVAVRLCTAGQERGRVEAVLGSAPCPVLLAPGMG